jgi:hypothetical protein
LGGSPIASTPPRHAESMKSARKCRRKCRGGMSRTRARFRPRSEHGNKGPPYA